MHTKYDHLPGDEDNIVYVRTVTWDELPLEIREKVGEGDHLYAVCDAEGTQLALVRDQQSAFVLARQNDMAPVYVH